MTAPQRRHRADLADARCLAAFRAAVSDPAAKGIALVAVGGYGRRELAPFSDLDVVLLHADQVPVDGVADRIWYPLWDAGLRLDHAVRALSQATGSAREDLRVALGLLDARHLAGDPSLTLRMRSEVLAHWRRDARQRMPELQDMVSSRAARWGELAQVAVPHLKESAGGLRDTTVLQALVATWLVDVPHVELGRCRDRLLDVRDALHEVTDRPTDRVAPELWPDLADRLGLTSADEAQRLVRATGRRVTHLSRLTWRRVEAAVEPRRSGPRQAALVPVAAGVARSGNEIVLDRGVEPGADPLLLLRASAEAAERDLVLAPATAARLAVAVGDLAVPWNPVARTLFVRLLASGPGLLGVWETLDETGALRRLLPEWELVRLLPHASPVHRFTVDRHLVETCIEAARLIRRVARPDLLMLAALLHDIGKGQAADHSVTGAPVAAEIARRAGFTEPDADRVAALVRHHLLLATVATSRDLADPATLDHVVDRVTDVETLDLLEVLTEADARATAAQAWTPWRSRLVADLADRVRRCLAAGPARSAPVEAPAYVEIPAPVRGEPGRVHVTRTGDRHGGTVTVVSGDRLGLMAAVSGALALQRVGIRAARAWSQQQYAVSVWEVDDTSFDEAILRHQILVLLDGRTDPTSRLRRPPAGALPPSVAVRHEASAQATVLEVRVEDRPGVVHLVCAALAAAGISVRSAHVDTLGPQAVDVFYLQEPSAGALSDDRAAGAAHAVRRALAGAVTLDA